MESAVSNAEHSYTVPKREIFSPMEMPKWEKSEAYQEYTGFITALSEAVRGKKLTDDCVVSEITTNILSLLDKLDQWVDETPPMEQPQRFGNKAFRTFFDRLKKDLDEILKEFLPPNFHSAIPEIGIYLLESVGNSTRIDYGTGHEMSFISFLCCLFKIGALTDADRPAAVLRIFDRYLKLMRKLQLTYRMEPAGSHGVWSLDDYQFVPFIWGSAQLQGHPQLEPKQFTDEKIVEEQHENYMFFGCIKFILSVKTGPFAEHSNQLWNISGVPSWTKVNTGLMKMYKAEVLAKYPVMQHVLFGSLLPITVAKQPIMRRPQPPQLR